MIIFYIVLTTLILIPILYLVFIKIKPKRHHLRANNRYLHYIDNCNYCNGIGFELNDESNAIISDYSLSPCPHCNAYEMYGQGESQDIQETIIQQRLNDFIQQQGEA